MRNYIVQRDPHNPLIAVSIDGEGKSQYVPHAVRLSEKLHKGEVWCVVKGDDTRSIHAYSSNDKGYSFEYRGKIIAPTGRTSDWDGGTCLDPVMTYDEETDLIHYLWKGHSNPSATPSYAGWAVGHGTAPGSDPRKVKRDPNPILTSAEVEQYYKTNAPHLGVTSVGDLYMSDVIKDPKGYLTFWGGFSDRNSKNYRIFRCRSDEGWSKISPRVEGFIEPASPRYDFVQAPCVYFVPPDPDKRKDPGQYVMIFTEGHDSGKLGALNLTTATCPADGNWKWELSGHTILTNGPYWAWDGKLVYAAHLLKGGEKYDTPILVNNALRLYYSGQQNDDRAHRAQSGAASLTILDVAILP